MSGWSWDGWITITRVCLHICLSLAYLSHLSWHDHCLYRNVPCSPDTTCGVWAAQTKPNLFLILWQLLHTGIMGYDILLKLNSSHEFQISTCFIGACWCQWPVIKWSIVVTAPTSGVRSLTCPVALVPCPVSTRHLVSSPPLSALISGRGKISVYWCKLGGRCKLQSCHSTQTDTKWY